VEQLQLWLGIEAGNVWGRDEFERALLFTVGKELAGFQVASTSTVCVGQGARVSFSANNNKLLTRD
jgi:hypothetical protein